MKHFLLCIFLFLQITALAQTVSVEGSVVDGKDQSGLPGATVVLTRIPDSTRFISITDAAGKFKFTLVPGTYVLRTSFLSYLTYSRQIEIKNAPTSLGNVALQVNAKSLNEVKIVGQIPPVTQKADTTEFNAAAFKTNPDANAEDLIEKLPGVVIDNGKVQAQGEDVRKVLVDGKAFFGDDAVATLKNLPAEIIDKIQIYDRISEEARLSGVDDGELNRTINIVTKLNMRSGTFGKVYAGLGNDDRYNTGLNLNQFKGEKRLTVLAQSNTINQQNFASVDLLGVMGGGGSRKQERQESKESKRNSRGGNGGGNNVRGAGDFLVPEMGGITQTHAVGINYINRWGKNIAVSGSYFGNYTDNDGFENSFRRYISDQVRTDSMLENETVSSKNTNHRANLKIEYDLDSANSLYLEPSLTFQYNNGLSDYASRSFYQNKPINENITSSNSQLLAYNFSNQLLFRHKFGKKGRSASVGVRFGINNNGGDNFFLADTRFYRRNQFDLDDQLKTLDMGGWSIGPSLAYTEPLGRKGNQINFSYRGNFASNDSEKLTFNYWEPDYYYTDQVDTLSNVFFSNNNSHQFGMGFRFKVKDLVISARGSYQYSELKNERIFPSYRYGAQDFHNFVPNLTLRYNISRQKNFQLLYFGNNNNPSIEQLQNVLDNTNRLQLRTGNPDLNQFYRNVLTFQYKATNLKNYSNFNLGVTGTLTSNQIASNRIVNNSLDTLYFFDIRLLPDAQLIRPVNLNGGQSFKTFMSYGLPVKQIKSNVNLDVSADYGRNPGILNNIANFSYTQNYGYGLSVTSNISENLDFTLSTRGTYYLSSNTLNPKLNTQYLNQRNRVRINYIFWKDLVFQTDFTQRLNSGLASGFNQNSSLWNLSLGKKFLKRNAGDLRFTVFDVLNQNNNVNRRINNSYIEDVETRVLQRYYMLTFSYNVRKFGPGAAPVRGQGKGGQKEKNKAGKKAGGQNNNAVDDF